MFKKLKTETIQAFLDEARYLDSKPQETHNMNSWKCGTTSCAVGDMAARGVCNLKISGGTLYYLNGMNWDAVIDAFDITQKEARFLFGGEFYLEKRSGEIPQQTANRIRKYLYYRMRKAEILADYEKARRTGDIGICQQYALALV